MDHPLPQPQALERPTVQGAGHEARPTTRQPGAGKEQGGVRSSSRVLGPQWGSPEAMHAGELALPFLQSGGRLCFLWGFS